MQSRKPGKLSYHPAQINTSTPFWRWRRSASLSLDWMGQFLRGNLLHWACAPSTLNIPHTQFALLLPGLSPVLHILHFCSLLQKLCKSYLPEVFHHKSFQNQVLLPLHLLLTLYSISFSLLCFVLFCWILIFP